MRKLKVGDSIIFNIKSPDETITKNGIIISVYSNGSYKVQEQTNSGQTFVWPDPNTGELVCGEMAIGNPRLGWSK